MSRPFIVLGDKLSHGGSVVAVSSQTDIDGKPVARVGDQTQCALHGSGTIVAGDASILVDGKPVARHGDAASCGATLVASQTHTLLR